MSKITLNIVEPGSPTPAPVVPNTGLFTSGIGGPEATAIGAVFVLAIAAIVAAILYRRHKKAGKVTKLVHIIDQAKAIIKSKKRITAGLAAISLLVSAGTFMALTKNGVNATDADNQTEDETGLTVNVSDKDLTIEVDDEPVFAVLPVEVTVEEATEAGYTLTTYADNTDLVSTTNSNNKIPMVTVEGDGLTTLKDNTYGLTIGEEPEGKDSEVYTALSTDQDNPTLITDKDYEATEANDTTTIYYGFYITPDMPYGTYTNDSEINYNAITNSSEVIFDGNGLYFNEDQTQTTNAVEYATVPAGDFVIIHSSSVNNNGDQTGKYDEEQRLENITIPGVSTVKVNVRYGFTANTAGIMIVEGNWDGNWETISENMVELYSEEENLFGTEEHTFDGDTVTIYSDSWGVPEDGYDYGYYITVTGYDADGNIVRPMTKKIVSGTYLIPTSSSPYAFLGWSEDKDATEPTYTTEEEIERKAIFIPNKTITLYAVWSDCPSNSICYMPNGANGTTTMSNQRAYSGSGMILWPSNYKYDVDNDGHNDYGFAGWSEDEDAATKLTDDDLSNNPKVYGPAQTISVGDIGKKGMKLYAVWITPAENATFQNFVCPNDIDMPIGSVVALRDNRDNEVYAVAKLADGNCWMMENLRLDGSATINKTNTHNPENDFTALTYSNNWCMEDSESCYHQNYFNNDNVTDTVPEMTTTKANIFSYGNYYNWYSATAGNGTYNKTSGNVTGDICPVGWMLPMGGRNRSTGSFYYLNRALNNGSTDTWAERKWRSFPNNFINPGGYALNSAFNRGNDNYYWTSTAYNTTNSYEVSSSITTALYLEVYNLKRNGKSVRCVSLAQQ